MTPGSGGHSDGQFWSIPAEMRNLVALGLYALALTVSATLLFLMEPMIAKMLLPLMGGSPAVWNTCMVFFQLTLLLGYLYAHFVSTRLNEKQQMIVHTVVLLMPLFFLPTSVAGRGAPSPDQDPVIWLLFALALVVGFPFFAVSTSSPLLQSWFAKLNLKSSTDPYFLFTASNFGSLLGLVSYPFLIEPRWTLSEQSRYWMFAYVFLLLLTGLCGFLRMKAAATAPQSADESPPVQPVPIDGEDQEPRMGSAVDPEKAPEEGDAVAEPVTSRRRWQWIMYTALPSSYVLGLTTYVTVEMAALPLFWVIPLATYLLTIMLAFARLPQIVYRVLGWCLPWLIIANFLLVSISTIGRGVHDVLMGLPLQIITLFVVSLVFHGKVAADRPGTQHLTEYYLLFSVGGMLGSVFNALVAPLIFNAPIEYPLMIGLVFVLAVTNPLRKRSWPTDRYFPAWVLPLVIAVMSYVLFSDPSRDFWLGVQKIPQVMFFDQGWRLLTPILIALFFAKSKIELRASLLALFLIATIVGSHDPSVMHRNRSFFGVLSVRVLHSVNVVDLLHDTILHGQQSLDPAFRHEPYSYYTGEGTIGLLLTKLFGKPDKPGVEPIDGSSLPPYAVVGLGTGTCVAYAHKGQRVDLFEINPRVVRIASDPFYFTYLYSAYKRGVKMNFLLGDARMKMKEVPDNGYELIILDAFSGDAPPLHLMTREALQQYLQKLAPGGIIAYHCSSKYYDMISAVWNLATDAHLHALSCYGDYPDQKSHKAGSLWVFVSEDKSKLEKVKQKPLWLWTPVDTKPNERVWTDDYCNPTAFLKTKHYDLGLVEVYRKPDGTLGRRYVR